MAKKRQTVETNGKATVSDEQIERFQTFIVNNLPTWTRSQLGRHLSAGEGDRRRNIDAECGNPSTSEMDPQFYQELYERMSIARRVCAVWPRECWIQEPEVYESEDAEVNTDFEIEWKELGLKLRSEEGPSYYRGVEGSAIWELLERADVMSRIGHYGLILLGINDGSPLSSPATLYKPEQGKNKQRELLYTRVFSEAQATIAKREDRRNNPRYGRPVEYQLQLDDPADDSDNGPGQSIDYDRGQKVHWTRIVHLADNLQSNEHKGDPAMMPVANELNAIKKVLYGCGEMYYRGALPGWAFKTHPTLGTKVRIDKEDLREMIEDFQNGLQRFVSLIGMDVKSLAPQVVDPTSQIMVLLKAICIILEIPERIFYGSERGELASSQDARAWAKRVRRRRVRYLVPRVIVPFVNRLIDLRVLPVPDGFFCMWPDEDPYSPGEKALVTKARTDSMAVYVEKGVDVLIAPMDYLTRELDYTEEEALAILAASEPIKEEKEAKEEEEKALEQEKFESGQDLERELAKQKPKPGGFSGSGKP